MQYISCNFSWNSRNKVKQKTRTGTNKQQNARQQVKHKFQNYQFQRNTMMKEGCILTQVTSRKIQLIEIFTKRWMDFHLTGKRQLTSIHYLQIANLTHKVTPIKIHFPIAFDFTVLYGHSKYQYQSKELEIFRCRD